MLHNEARKLVVEAYKKTHNAQEVADLFSISKWTVYHMMQKMRATGSVELRTNQRGRKQLLDNTVLSEIKDLIEQQPDITINEICDTLHLKASYTTVERAVIKLGFSIKKKSLHATEQERPRCAGKTIRVERKHVPKE